MERQEKLKLDADIKNILKQYEEQKQENKAIRRENENIKRMIKEEFERKQHKQVKIMMCFQPCFYFDNDCAKQLAYVAIFSLTWSSWH